MAALLDMSEQPLSDVEYERLARMLEQARESSEAK
jgi:hypothetical protein